MFVIFSKCIMIQADMSTQSTYILSLMSTDISTVQIVQMHNRSTTYQSPTASQDNGVVSNGNDEMAQKVLKYKARKAKNQRRYYQKYVYLSMYLLLSSSYSAISHKDIQQAKGRQRSAR